MTEMLSVVHKVQLTMCVSAALTKNVSDLKMAIRARLKKDHETFRKFPNIHKSSICSLYVVPTMHFL